MKRYMGLDYHKIQSMFKRDKASHKIILNDWTLPEFEFLANNAWVWTEKIDGTNMRICYKDGELSINGRSNNADIPRDLEDSIDNLFTTALPYLQESFSEGTEVIFFGEGYGAGIQSGGCYRKEKGFVLFDININGCYLDKSNVQDIGAKMGIDVVPIVGEGTLYDAIKQVEAGMKSKYGDFIAEGLVVVPKVEFRNRKGERLISKIKHCDFNGQYHLGNKEIQTSSSN